MQLRITNLYNRVAHPAPPMAPEVIDRDIVRRALEGAGWNVDLAERRHRLYRRIIRERDAAAASAAQQPANDPAAGPDPADDDDQGLGNDADTHPPSGSGSGSDSPNNGENLPIPTLLFTGPTLIPYPTVEDEPSKPVSKLQGQRLVAAFKNSRLPSTSGEQERRDAALAFATAVKDLAVLSISEAVLLMQLAGWDISIAVTEFNSLVGARRRLRYHFDGLRRLIPNVDDQIQESRSLQLLTEITGRNDWYSLLLALRKANWNLTAVIVQWYKQGIPVFEKKDLPKEKRKTEGWGSRADRYARRQKMPDEASTKPPGDVDHSSWAREPYFYSHPEDRNPIQPLIYGKKWRDEKPVREAKAKKQKSKRADRQEGFVINEDRDTVKPGLAYDGNFLFEWFHRGQYWFKVFNRSEFEWPQLIEDTDSDSDDTDTSDSPPPPRPLRSSTTPPSRPDPVPFDSNNKARLELLNKWRMNTFLIVTLESKRPFTQKWTDEELEFLYQLQKALYESYKKQYPRSTRRELLPLPEVLMAEKLEWERKFNAQFANTIPPGHTEPRRHRNFGAILQHRARFPRLAAHFRIKLNSDFEKKLSKEDKDALKQFKKERDEFEEADAKTTEDYNDAHPTNDPVEGRMTKKRRNPESSSEAGSGDGNGNGQGGDGAGPGDDHEADGGQGARRTRRRQG